MGPDGKDPGDQLKTNKKPSDAEITNTDLKRCDKKVSRQKACKQNQADSEQQ